MISLLAKTFSLKVIKAAILSIDTYEQHMIEVGNKNKKNKNKDRCNHCNHMSMQSLLGANHHLTLCHMAKSFILPEETKERINKFSIGYMIIQILNINKLFIEQVNKFTKSTFGAITQHYVQTTLAKKENRSVIIINVL